LEIEGSQCLSIGIWDDLTTGKANLYCKVGTKCENPIYPICSEWVNQRCVLAHNDKMTENEGSGRQEKCINTQKKLEMIRCCYKKNGLNMNPTWQPTYKCAAHKSGLIKNKTLKKDKK